MMIKTKNIAADEIICPWDSAAVSASPSDSKVYPDGKDSLKASISFLIEDSTPDANSPVHILP